ncbi:MAG TPA: DUF2726 domain-containing protein [Povalibacter sp.]|nr:DUF2726 domain-containing protein [Povalibacter sp.]
MEWLFLIVLVLIVAVAAAGKVRVAAPKTWPLRPVPVLSKSEQVLFWRLREALPERVVLAQVQLSRLVKIDAAGRARLAVLNRIDRKSTDFVVCSKDLQPLCVVELDDSSHTRASQRKRDADKDAALQAAGLRVVRYHVKSMPAVAEIRNTIELPEVRTDSIAVARPVAASVP